MRRPRQPPYKKHSKPRPAVHFRIGEQVYFHAFAGTREQPTSFLCRGYIARLPIRNSPVYKVIVTEVNPQTATIGVDRSQAVQLLGKRIAREGRNLLRQPSNMLNKLYSKSLESGWIQVNEVQLQKIKRKVQKLQETKGQQHDRRTSPDNRRR